MSRDPEFTPQPGEKLVFDKDVTIGDVVIFERDHIGLRIRALTERLRQVWNGPIYVLSAITSDGQAHFTEVGADELAP